MGIVDKGVPPLDFEETTDEVVGFVRKVVEGAEASGVVIGLSGGVDSSLVATLCVRALGKDRVLGLLMPAEFTPKQDVEDAERLAAWLGVRTEIVPIQGICEAIFKTLNCAHGDVRCRIPVANVRARVRMLILYYYANLHNLLVVGTGDRSESLIGYFTKYGDGGVDLMPIVHLYKTQVRELARYLGVPVEIATKPSSPQLYPGHRATDEIPLEYEELDPVLVGLFDHKLSPREVSRTTGVQLEVVEEVLRRFNVSKHKRTYPPSIVRQQKQE
ncbi:MAG: NAD+ synthase [Candidatus Bathyarchaeia archaeon]